MFAADMLLKQLGINPDELKKTALDFMELAKQINVQQQEILAQISAVAIDLAQLRADIVGTPQAVYSPPATPLQIEKEVTQ